MIYIIRLTIIILYLLNFNVILSYEYKENIIAAQPDEIIDLGLGEKSNNNNNYYTKNNATNEMKNVHTPATRISSSDYISTPDTWESNPDLKSLWVYRPPSILPHLPDVAASRHVFLKPRHLITKLVKPLYYGFNPFFEKRDFEPFERRQKPITIVAFRKNGEEPHQAINTRNKESAEVAEIQSSFNDVSNFWHELPGVR